MLTNPPIPSLPPALRPLAFPLGVLACYWLLLIHQLGAQWSLYEQYNYGWSVPFLCVYLIWRSAKRPAPSAERPAQGASRLALCALALCAFLYAPTRFVHEANPVWRLTSLLWTLEIIGLTLLVVRLGLGGKRTAQVAFPVCFFLLAVPWPYPVESFLVESLTRLNVGTTIELLGLFGVPAVQHANVIEIGTGMVGIDEACSGIRSFQATLMISLFLGELYRLSVARRALCVIAGFGFAFVFNVGRTLLLTRIAAVKGTDAIAAWHDPAGVTILVVCFISLWLLALRLRKESPVQGSRFKVQSSMFQPRSLPLAPFLPRLGFALAAWLILVEGATELWYRSHEGATAQQAVWSVRLPTGYRTKEVQKLVASEFKYDESTEAEWEDANGAQWQLFYFRWHPAHLLDRRVRVQRAKMHGPETCLTHIGMTLESDLGASVLTVGDFKLAIQQYLFEADGKALHVFFGIYEDQTGSAVLANRRIGTARRIDAALAGSRNYGQRFLEVAVSGYDRPEEAKAALVRELKKLIEVSK